MTILFHSLFTNLWIIKHSCYESVSDVYCDNYTWIFSCWLITATLTLHLLNPIISTKSGKAIATFITINLNLQRTSTTNYLMNTSVPSLINSWCLTWASQVALVVKQQQQQQQQQPHLPMQKTRDTGLIPGLRRSPGRGRENIVQYSCLENSMDRENQRATTHAITKHQT